MDGSKVQVKDEDLLKNWEKFAAKKKRNMKLAQNIQSNDLAQKTSENIEVLQVIITYNLIV